MNELQPPTVREFNPGLLQSDREVIAQYAVRNVELETALRILQENLDSPSCQHVLVVAPRGRGKTMLLARLAAELRTHEERSRRFLPVRFMEESHEVFSLADFWLEALFYLANEIAADAPELSRELRASHADLKSRWRERELADRARAAVMNAGESLDRHLVLMVENLQALPDAVDDDFGWGLRQALQTEPRLTLVATATSRFEALDDAGHAFYELFRVLCLNPLDAGSCRRLWQAVGGDERTEREIEPIRILTGGSPRLLVIVARFARHLSLHRLMEELVTLIDVHTEYFRSYLDGIPKVERRVFLALVDLWQPSSAGEIAARASLDLRMVSTMLGRLVDRGAVLAEGSRGKRLYSAAEGLYCFYYKLRREREHAFVVRSLVLFMSACFAEKDLRQILAASQVNASSVVREGVRLAVAAEPRLAGLIFDEGRAASDRRAGADNRADPFARIAAAFDGKDYERVVELADRVLRNERSGSGTDVARTMVMKGRSHAELGDYPAAIAVCADAIERFAGRTAPELREQVAMAYVAKGASEHMIGDSALAIASLDKAIEFCGADAAPALRLTAARALYSKGVVLERTGDAEAAIASLDKAIEFCGADAAPALRLTAARALYNKGVMLERTGDAEAAIAAWNGVADCLGADGDAEHRETVARARYNKGIAQNGIGDSEAAIATCSALAEDFGCDDVPEVQGIVSAALLSVVEWLARRRDHKGAISTCDEIVRRFESANELVLRQAVATAMTAKAGELVQLERSADAIKVCAEIDGRFGTSNETVFRGAIAMALAAKASALAQLGRTQEAVAVCAEIDGRFGTSNETVFRVAIAMALAAKASALAQLGRTQEAVAVGDEIDRRFGAKSEESFQMQVSFALAAKAAAQELAGRSEDAIATCDRLVRRLDASDSQDLRPWAVPALWQKAWGEVEIGRVDAALRTCDELDLRLNELEGNEQWRRRAAWPRMKAWVVQKRYAPALDAFRSAWTTCDADNAAELQEFLMLAIELVASGAPERGLVEALAADEYGSARLAPLLVALRRRAGELVRAPAEIMAVAAEVDRLIEERKAGGSFVPDPPQGDP